MRDIDIWYSVLTWSIQKKVSTIHLPDEPEFYSEIVIKADEDAEDFMAKIRELRKSQPSEELDKFAELIGSEIKEDDQ